MCVGLVIISYSYHQVEFGIYQTSWVVNQGTFLQSSVYSPLLQASDEERPREGSAWMVKTALGDNFKNMRPEDGVPVCLIEKKRGCLGFLLLGQGGPVPSRTRRRSSLTELDIIRQVSHERASYDIIEIIAVTKLG